MTPGAEPSRRVRLGSWGLLAGALLASGLSVWLMIAVGPAALDVYDGLCMIPPKVVYVLLSPPYLLVLPILAVAGVAKELWLRDRWLTLRINAGHLVGVILLTWAHWTVMFWSLMHRPLL